MEHTYWQKQSQSKPLFPDVAWSKPEQRSRAGHLGIIGGNKLGFAGVAEAYATAMQAGVGKATVLLPDALKNTVPTTILDTLFAPSTTSGGLSKDSLLELRALGHESNALLFIGDAGRNSETAVLYEQFLQEYEGMATLSRDAIDLVKNNAKLLAERPNTLLVASFAQVQKLFQAVYYPKVLTFNMHLMQLVEALHKFTITYPVAIVTLHKDTLIIAHAGEIVTQAWENPMAIWRGHVATNAASWWLWNPDKVLQAVATSLER
jgi:NAD(P)H-hydrate repair Nnr-like enzyme with NAD(P)H-hydrate dehydratase domain